MTATTNILEHSSVQEEMTSQSLSMLKEDINQITKIKVKATNSLLQSKDNVLVLLRTLCLRLYTGSFSNSKTHKVKVAIKH